MPNRDSGPIETAPGETWGAVDSAFCRRTRGLACSEYPSLSEYLRFNFDGNNMRRPTSKKASRKPHLTVPEVLRLADSFYAAHGRWPDDRSGPVSATSRETWGGISKALCLGQRGLPHTGGIATLLAQQRGKRMRAEPPPLNVDAIIAWAQAHNRRMGKWPIHSSGPIPESPGDSWNSVYRAFKEGRRGMIEGSSLADLLRARCGATFRRDKPVLSIKQILTWADAHYAANGRYPHRNTGIVKASPEFTWAQIDTALRDGTMSLPSGLSISRLLALQRGKRNILALPNLTVNQIAAWALHHFERNGKLPSTLSGNVDEAPGEKWCNINRALLSGSRGLRGCGYRNLREIFYDMCTSPSTEISKGT